MPIFEISGFNKGISKSGVTFLEPSGSYSDLEDGFIYRQELKSRLGFQQFATGGLSDWPLVASKGMLPSSDLIKDEDVKNSDNNAEQTFNLSITPVKTTYIIINVDDSVLGAKQIKSTYNGTTWVFSGDYDSGGTNSINASSGDITVTFDTTLTGGDSILVTYEITTDNSLTATATAQQTFTIANIPLVRNYVTVYNDDKSKTVNIYAAPHAGYSTNTNTFTFCLTPIPLDLSDITISITDSLLGVKEIVASYSGGWSFSGDYNAGGTNSVDETTGEVIVTFDTPLTGGDLFTIDYLNNDGAIFVGNVDCSLDNTINWTTGEIEVGFDGALTATTLSLTYYYYASLRIMGIFEHIDENETREMLVFDKNYLYKYDGNTNTLQQVPFTSSDPITTLGITNNEDYVSGTSYPDKDYNGRFVFTGQGLDDVYFYDGYGIKRFTNAVDNADYEAFGASPQTLTRAKHVFFYGERINFVYPTLAGIAYQQGILYSAIRNSSGNGDKFNTSGSGLINLDTRDFLSGYQIVDDMVALTLYESNWMLEKTVDPFNPYSTRELSNEFGTEASFASVARSSKVESFGKIGIMDNDTNRVLLVDDDIPNFTRDEVDPVDIDLTYGGYDNTNRQIMFAYSSSENTLTDTQDKVLTHNWQEKSWSKFNQRFSCFGHSETGYSLILNQIDESVKASWVSLNTTEETLNTLGLSQAYKKDLAGDDYGFIYELNQDFDDYTNRIFGITQASSAVLTIDEHAFEVGDTVKIENVEGMEDDDGNSGINSNDSGLEYYTITAKTTNTITLNVDTTSFTAYSTGGLVSKVIDFRAVLNEFNPWREEGRQCYLKEIEFLIDNNGASMLVSLEDSNGDNDYIKNVIIQPTSTVKKKEYVKLSVENIADFHTIKMEQLSRSNQLIIKSLRIRAERAGFTND